MLPYGLSRDRTSVSTLGQVHIIKQGDDTGRKGNCAMTCRSWGRALRKALDEGGKLGRAVHCGRKSQNGTEEGKQRKKERWPRRRRGNPAPLNISAVEKIRHCKGLVFPAAVGKVAIPLSTACLVSHSQSHVQSRKSIMALTRTRAEGTRSPRQWQSGTGTPQRNNTHLKGITGSLHLLMPPAAAWQHVQAQAATANALHRKISYRKKKAYDRDDPYSLSLCKEQVEKYLSGLDEHLSSVTVPKEKLCIRPWCSAWPFWLSKVTLSHGKHTFHTFPKAEPLILRSGKLETTQNRTPPRQVSLSHIVEILPTVVKVRWFYF